MAGVFVCLGGVRLSVLRVGPFGRRVLECAGRCVLECVGLCLSVCLCSVFDAERKLTIYRQGPGTVKQS